MSPAGGRARLVHARRPAAEDEPRRVQLFQLSPRCRPGDELAVDACLTHPARDELAKLRSEVEHQDRLLSGTAFDLLAGAGSRRGLCRQLSFSPYPRAGLA